MTIELAPPPSEDGSIDKRLEELRRRHAVVVNLIRALESYSRIQMKGLRRMPAADRASSWRSTIAS